MTPEEAGARAITWLEANGYTRWDDGQWCYEGHEVDIQGVLAEYIYDNYVQAMSNKG